MVVTCATFKPVSHHLVHDNVEEVVEKSSPLTVPYLAQNERLMSAWDLLLLPEGQHKQGRYNTSCQATLSSPPL